MAMKGSQRIRLSIIEEKPIKRLIHQACTFANVRAIRQRKRMENNFKVKGNKKVGGKSYLLTV